MVTSDAVEARAAAERFGFPVVIKADGLAAGKGVVIANSRDEAMAAIQGMLGGSLGDAGRRLVIEQYIRGEEMTYLVLSTRKVNSREPTYSVKLFSTASFSALLKKSRAR